jgi:DNA (cytosine-5)-methyltransferase 1
MTTTQVPIIAWERRYMTPLECARLQSLDDLPHLPKASTRAFKALGNAVNASLIQRIAEQLLKPTHKNSRAKQKLYQVVRVTDTEPRAHANA